MSHDNDTEEVVDLSGIDEPILFGYITDASAVAFSAKLLSLHSELDDGHSITLYIASDGGDEHASRFIAGILAQIRRDGRKITGHVIGDCCSMAFYILQMCDKRTADPLASIMLHRMTITPNEGMTPQQLSVQGAEQYRIELIWLALLASRTGKTPQYYLQKIAAQDWYLSAEQAFYEGFLDELESVPALARAPFLGRKPERTKPRKRR